MILVQITDFHVPAEDGPLPEGFDPAADLAHAVAVLNGLDPQPDLVIATGDLADEATPEEYEHLVRLLAPLSAPLAVIPGNHDAAAPITHAFGSMARMGPGAPFVHRADILDDPRFGPFKLILLDTHAPRVTGGVMCEARLAWLESQLASDPDLPVFIAMHHPPFVTGLPVFDGFGFEGMEAFRALIARHPQVDRIICGHIHRSLTGEAGGVPVVVAPSTTYALTLELRPGERLRHLPDAPGLVLHMRTGPRDWVSHVRPLRARA